MELALVILLVAVVVAVVSAPLRPGRAKAAEEGESADRAELEAARDAKYREIRDAELDYRTGKLSEGDWRAQDRALKREAVEVLRRLDELESATSPAPIGRPDGRNGSLG